MPNRINPIARYLFALSAMIVAYTLYAKLAVPFLEGPPQISRRPPSPNLPVDSGDHLDKSHLPSLVPAGEWELGPCKTLLTPQGTVYFEYWEPVDDEGTYSLMPFTIVINDPVNRIHTATPRKPGDKNASPIVLRAQKGAQLKFNKPLTARSGNEKVEMESAWLEGQVTLFRPENLANKEQELRVVTSNIQINRQQIFTLDDVYFSIGLHHGSGRNLSIKLAHEKDDDTPEEGFDNIKGVEQMELAYVSELVLNPASKSKQSFSADAAAQKSDMLGSELSLSNQKTPLQLSCDGPFVFRMEEQKAWFHDNVKVVQLNGVGDNLQCDSLQIEFDKPEGKSTSVSNLIAIGTVDQPAVIDAISRQTRIAGQELIFDVPNSIVKANGSQPVNIQSPKLAFVAKSLWYQLGENGKIGELDAAGPGFLQGVSNDGKRSFRVDWAHRLTTRSVDKERIQIDIEQEAKVQFDASNRIASDNLRFIVWEMPGADSTEKKPTWQYLPSRLTSAGRVNISSEKLEGTADELVANWPRPTQRQLGTVRHSVSYRRTQDGFKPAWSRPETPSAKPIQQPTKFAGRRILANVEGDLENMQIRSLNVDGMVSLETFPQDRDPVAITGHAMKLVPQGPEVYRVTIESSTDRPATFRTNGFVLNGDSLQLDQKANTVWVDGGGDLELDARSQPKSFQPSDEKMADLDKVNVKWLGGMVFDGSKIYFENDVRLDAARLPEENGQRAVISTRSEAVTIELSERIQFEELSSQKQEGDPEKRKPEVRRMIFVSDIDPGNRAFRLASHPNSKQAFEKQNVLIENATFDAAGKLIGLQKLNVPSATANAETGNVRTSGPGTAISYQYSDGKKSNRLSGFSHNNPDRTSSKGPELSCVHCRFDGQLVANSKRGTMVIDENTRSAWSVVDSFDKTIDPDRPDQLPVGAAVLKSDKLEFAQWTPRNGVPRQDMKAEGNTSIRSQLFEAVANRLSYTDETDILIVESNPPADAMLARRSSPTAEPETVLAQKILYRLSDQWFKVIDIRSIDAKLPARKK